MSSCCVPTCENYYQKTKERGVVYHRFPRDPEIRLKWQQCIQLKENHKPKTLFVCSDHFHPENYERDLKAELLNLPVKKRLKKDAAPTLNLEDLRPDSNEGINTLHVDSDSQCAVLQAKQNLTKRSMVKVLKDPKLEHELEIRNLRTTLSHKVNEIRSLRAKLRKSRARTRSLNQKIAECKRLHKRVKSRIKQGVTQVLRKCFTPGQINRLLSGQRVNWQAVDIVSATSIRAVSEKAYLHLKNVIGLPLPGISTLKTWANRSNQSLPGFMSEAFLSMTQCGSTLSTTERLTILVLDEISIASQTCYDRETDTVLVLMARGLASDLKQIIYYQFNQKMTSEIIQEAVRSLEEIEFPVAAFVYKMGGGNRGLRNALGISTERTSFLNPHDPSRSVHVFADVPHLMKLLGYHFLESGLVINGVTIDRKVIESLVQKDREELEITKLRSLLDVVGSNRKRVNVAVQLFSHSTTTAIRTFFPDLKECIEFFELANNFSDVMNSVGSECDLNGLRCGFGVDEYREEQMAVVCQMLHTIQDLRVSGKRRLLPFQRGIVISIKSLLSLFESELLISSGARHILTSRLNLEESQSTFSQLRGMGIFQNYPLPTDVEDHTNPLTSGVLCNVPTGGASVISDVMRTEPPITEQHFQDLKDSLVASEDDTEGANILTVDAEDVSRDTKTISIDSSVEAQLILEHTDETKFNPICNIDIL